MKHIVLLGAGTAGTLMANKLVARLPASEWQITIIDRDDEHVYQPGLLFVPFGTYRPNEIVRSRREFLPDGVNFEIGEIDRVDSEGRAVVLTDGRSFDYDILIVATGVELHPEATDGLTGEGWHETAFDFYTLKGATALRDAFERFDGGRIVLNVVDMPIKCPVAPLEFAFLADAYFTERGIRDRVELLFATPLEGAFTKPIAAKALSSMLDEKGIQVDPLFHVSRVNGATRTIESFEGRTHSYDLLVTVPLHGGAAFIERSGLGDGSGFVRTDNHTLQNLDHPEIFALGDATNLPTSKAGSVAHFQGEVLIENVVRFIEEKPLAPDFDGHANCFIETGHGKAMLIDFNYEQEPLSGKFPLPAIGPFTLLGESAVNHWGKLGFRWIYWNMLLRGEELPIDHRMVMAGKKVPA